MKRFDSVGALALMPRLVQLIDTRLRVGKGEHTRYWSFRKVMAVMDLAQLKLNIRKPEDARLHLIEAERLFQDIPHEEG